MREAFETVARDYERLHPGVRVTQIPIPERIFPEWATTQLVGGTAPDLIEIGLNASGVDSSTDERLVRYYEPLGGALTAPNPYDAADPDLATLPWRDTFVDGLRSVYNPRLLEFYSVPTTLTTVRVFYNRQLWRRLLGDTPPPRTYEEFAAVCRRAAAGVPPIIPVAGSSYTAYWLINAVFASQTQRLWTDPMRGLEASGENIEQRVQRAYLTGALTLDDPAVHSGFEIEREVGQFMQPGFFEASREDALFLFTQGKALMITTGSWDAANLRQQSPFDIGAFPVPLPARDNPRYGRFVLGPVSEAGRSTTVAFGLYAGSAHREQALDFLRFLTSRKQNGAFTRRSGWLPAVVGVEAPPEMKAFEPVFDGYVSGFDPATGPDSVRLLNTQYYVLFNAGGSVPRFVDAIRDGFRPAMVSELQLKARDAAEQIRAEDTAIAAYGRLTRGVAPPDSDEARDAATRVSELNESQTLRELTLYGITLDLHNTGQAPP